MPGIPTANPRRPPRAGTGVSAFNTISAASASTATMASSAGLVPAVSRVIRPLASAAAMLLVVSPWTGAAGLAAQEPTDRLPFGIGEELVFEITASRLGTIGRGAMRVEGPERIRDRETLLLRFDIDGGVGPVRIVDETRSWLDPRTMAALRYSKHERHPLARRSEAVELYPDERRWVAEDGGAGSTASDRPLDELSFLYFIRTLDLADGAEYVVDRHFDRERNPVVIRVLGREQTAAPSGIFNTVVVEMRVHDGKRFGGDGVIRLHLTDDEYRYPVRVITSVPVAGTLVLDLTALVPGDVVAPTAVGNLPTRSAESPHARSRRSSDRSSPSLPTDAERARP